jgi:hypothetical protein
MLHLQQKHIFCGWSRNIYFEDQPHPPLILGRSFLKTVRAIDVGKWEIKFNIDGVRSACYMEAETVHKQVRTLSDFSIAPFPFFLYVIPCATSWLVIVSNSIILRLHVS